MNSYEMLKDTLIKNFSYHDGKIIEFKKDGFDYILKFRDGWVDEQINEIAELYGVNLKRKVIRRACDRFRILRD